MAWEIKRDGVVVCWGSAETRPSAEECKRFRNDGYKVYIDGKEIKK